MIKLNGLLNLYIVLTIKNLKDAIRGIWLFSINAGFPLANVKQTLGFSITNWFLLNHLHKLCVLYVYTATPVCGNEIFYSIFRLDPAWND